MSAPDLVPVVRWERDEGSGELPPSTWLATSGDLDPSWESTIRALRPGERVELVPCYYVTRLEERR